MYLRMAQWILVLIYDYGETEDYEVKSYRTPVDIWAKAFANPNKNCDYLVALQM